MRTFSLSWEELEENERIEAYARMKRAQEEKLAAEKDGLGGSHLLHGDNAGALDEV